MGTAVLETRFGGSPRSDISHQHQRCLCLHSPRGRLRYAERPILAELFERGGRAQLSGLRDRRPIERLVNKGFVERHTLNSQQEEYVLTAIGKKVLDNK
jgi:hypothetical protein